MFAQFSIHDHSEIERAVSTRITLKSMKPIFSEENSFGETQYLFDFYPFTESDPQGLGRIKYGLTASFWA